jgi:hypothetical protein
MGRSVAPYKIRRRAVELPNRSWRRKGAVPWVNSGVSEMEIGDLEHALVTNLLCFGVIDWKFSIIG